MTNRMTSIKRGLGNRSLAGAMMLVVFLSAGCALRPARQETAHYTPIATSAATAAPVGVESKDTDSTATAAIAAGRLRPANPESFGEGARLLVGREFDPVYFDGDTTELDGEARRRLNEYAGWLKDHAQVWVALVGYCDGGHGVRYGYNLAMARALAAEEFLVANGLDRKRIYSIGYGRASAGDHTGNRIEILGFMAPSEPALISAEPEEAPEPELPKPEVLP